MADSKIQSSRVFKSLAGGRKFSWKLLSSH